ncbi:MAG TPA: c-type cytochrome [Burkholderiales bacterium]|nr:c-type cytochrome [Burkholderiales bacterium]
MRLLRVVRAVLWSIFGVRRRSDATRDLQGAPLPMVIAAGVIAAGLVIGVIVTLVRVATPDRARQIVEAQAPVPITKAHGPVVVADTIEERVRPCTACHGSETQATKDGFSPRIAGKPADYLFNQLVSFRDGRRGYAPMVYLVQYMTDEYLREMSAYFAQLQLPYPPAERAALSDVQVARARRIVEQGDAARGVPACIECHGKSLSGVEPAVPSVLGLPRQYMNAQFGAWRNGKLRSVAPDCMAEVATRLAADDVPVLAAWLASQPVPPGMKPVRGARKLPLECGSPAPAGKSASQPTGRGAYLVAAGDCVACHTAIGGAPFAGGRAIETPFGTVYSTNLTDIRSWSRDEFWRALHEGRSKDGRLLYPAFPYPNFTQVTREDADAMYDYLRTLAPVERANTPHAIRFPYNTQAALSAWRMLFFREGIFEPKAGESAEWNRGAYLVRGLGHCDACHASRNMFGAVSHQLDLGGGLIPMQNWFAPPIAGWDAAHVEALLRSGVSPRASAMGPMAEVVYRSTQFLTAEDARAIATYVHSSAAKPAAVVSRAPDARTMQRGAAVYGEHCAECHGDKGEGAPPAYPALAGNPSMNAAVAANGIKAILNGGYAPVTGGNPRPYGMPPYFSRLSDAEVAAVLTYARASWGNSGTPVSAADVERYR